MSNELATQGPKNIVDQVGIKIKDLVASHDIQLPAGYSAGNALKEAYLMLQGVKDKNKRPALQVCTKESIATALLETVVMGLSPARKQVYFVVYGKDLTAMRSYMGSQALAKRLNPDIKSINSAVVRKGEEFIVEMVKGSPRVTSHKADFFGGGEIVGAYAVALDYEGEVVACEIMTLAEIHQAWKQSKQYPVKDDGSIKPGSVHDKFEQQMARRTVINRLCTKLINTSPESGLTQIIQQNAVHVAQATTQAEIDEKANQTVFEEDVIPEPELPTDAELAELATDDDPFEDMEA